MLGAFFDHDSLDSIIDDCQLYRQTCPDNPDSHTDWASRTSHQRLREQTSTEISAFLIGTLCNIVSP